MNCPVCNLELKIAERQGVEIDYCPKCRGVWLDRGELDKILERAEAEAAPRPAAAADAPRRHRDDTPDPEGYRRDDDYRKGYHDPRRRRRSFLGDLFDWD